MKFKKSIITLSSAFLLAACGGEGTTEPEADEGTTDGVEEVIEDPAAEETDTGGEGSEDPTEMSDEEPEEEPKEEPADTASVTHPYDSLVSEDNFVEAYGNQAWLDYKAVTADVTYGEVTILNEENADYSKIDGTSSEEIAEKFEAIDVRDEVFMDTLELSDTEFINYHRYPAAEDSEYSEMSDFLAELTFYYVDDNLMFSAITSGLYMLELGNLPQAEDLTKFLKVSEIEALDPQIYTIAEMKINGNNIQQIMIPATNVNEEGTEETLAFYFFTYGEDILYYAYIPFELVSQDFPSNSVRIYQQFIPELQKMELDEAT